MQLPSLSLSLDSRFKPVIPVLITSSSEFDDIDWEVPNQKILLERGLVLRKTITTAADNTYIGAYGTGNLPVLLGSTEVTSSWTNTSGSIYSTTLASAPDNVFERTAFTLEGMTKLIENTATPTAPTSGQWGYSSGSLYVYSDTDPNDKHYEQVTLTTTSTVDIQSNGCTVENIASLCSAHNGILFNLRVEGGIARNCDVYGPCNDGIDGESGGKPPTNILIENNRIRSAGTGVKNGGGGTGDGISFHNGTDPFSIIVRNNDIRECWKSGIGNQSGGNVLAYSNYLENNWDNLAIFGSAGSDGSQTTHRFHYNVCKNGTGNSRGFSITGASGLEGDVRVELWNNVLHGNKTSTKGAIFITDSDRLIFSIQNNIMTNWVKGVDSVFDTPTFEALDYNCMYGNTIDWYDNNTGNLQPSVGDNNLTDEDPLYTDSANGDFSLQDGSPCIDAGVDVGLTKDFEGNPVPVGSAPDIGAYEKAA